MGVGTGGCECNPRVDKRELEREEAMEGWRTSRETGTEGGWVNTVDRSNTRVHRAGNRVIRQILLQFKCANTGRLFGRTTGAEERRGVGVGGGGGGGRG